MNRTVLNLIAVAESSGGPAPLARQIALPAPGNMIFSGASNLLGGQSTEEGAQSSEFHSRTLLRFPGLIRFSLGLPCWMSALTRYRQLKSKCVADRAMTSQFPGWRLAAYAPCRPRPI
jgi:hypothetical protein